MNASAVEGYFEAVWQGALRGSLEGPAEAMPLGGGLELLLRFTGETVRSQLRPALAHLLQPRPAVAGADVVIAEGTQRLPAPPWPVSAYGARGLVSGLPERFRASYNFDSSVLAFCDLVTRRAVVWAREAERLPVYERAAPLLGVLPWLLAPTLATPEPRLVVHGGAVGHASGALLLAGRGGSGKSTTALAAWCAGFDYLADDYALLHETPAGPQVRSLYGSAKVDEPMLARLPELIRWGAPVPGAFDGPKRLLLAGTGTPAVAAARPLRALVLPRVAPDAAPVARLEPASAGEALRALAPSTLFQLRDSSPETTRCLARLAGTLPAFRLHLGTELDSVTAALRDLLGSLAP